MALSLAMIVRDEEETLGRVLADAASFCDELVVVDTGSQDASRDIAKAAGAQVLDFEWIDDFSAARNFAFDACTTDWVIWLDADDTVPAPVQAGLRELKPQLGDHLDAVFTPYHYRFAPGASEPLYSFNRERLIRRAAGLRWSGVVHEVLTIPAGRWIQRDDLYVEHRPDPRKDARRGDRNLRILEKAVAAGDRAPRTMYYFGNELADNGRYADALTAYAQYFDNPGAMWEQYAARLRMAACAEALGRSEEVIGHLLSALRRDPSRAEAYLRLGEVYYRREEWASAVPLLVAATEAQRPADGFIAEPDYSWLPWDYLGVCLSRLGRHGEAVNAVMKSLQQGNPDRDRLYHNVRWSAEQL